MSNFSNPMSTCNLQQQSQPSYAFMSNDPRVYEQLSTSYLTNSTHLSNHHHAAAAAAAAAAAHHQSQRSAYQYGASMSPQPQQHQQQNLNASTSGEYFKI